MTLNTDIRVVGKTDPFVLHAYINKNLLQRTEARFEYSSYDKDKWDTTVLMENAYPTVSGEIIPKGRLFNNPMQGLNAWLIVNWDEDGIPTTREEWPEDYEDSEYGLDEPVGAYLNISFDTAYGFNDNGVGCTELHATFIIDLAKNFFEPRGLDFYWKDEYSGEWYHGLDADGFTAFLGGGDHAREWFNHVVIPTISAEVAAEGGEITF